LSGGAALTRQNRSSQAGQGAAPPGFLVLRFQKLHRFIREIGKQAVDVSLVEQQQQVKQLIHIGDIIR
jgi:hypothetical protein